MGNIFSGSEIVEIGIRIEENGRDFYNVLIGQSGSPKAKEVFSFLAREEENHIKAFKGILEKTAKYEPQGMGADDYYAYMSALAGEHIFTQSDKGAEIAKQIKSDKEAIEKAIGFEQDSIVFYEGMKRVVPDYDKKIIDSLISQEEGHLRQLMGMKEAV